MAFDQQYRFYQYQQTQWCPPMAWSQWVQQSGARRWAGRKATGGAKIKLFIQIIEKMGNLMGYFFVVLIIWKIATFCSPKSGYFNNGIF